MTRLKILSLMILVSTQVHAKLVVHEWGTFTSLVGSNGQAQNGMYYEDEVLPDFVHNFGEARSAQRANGLQISSPRCPGPSKIPCEFLVDQAITQKMETPVVYFYSDKAQKVSFDVSFPGGIISQSYPASIFSRPEAIPGVELKNGFAHYEVKILKDQNLTPPQVAAENIYSHARNVASDLIQSGSEVEKFIFYRGLGEFKTKLQSTSHFGSLKLLNQGNDSIPAVFLVYTDGQNRGNILPLGGVNPQSALSVGSQQVQSLRSTQQPQKDFLQQARTHLLKALKAGGLFRDEAVAMIDTWESGYFKTPGLRILYVLGKNEVESILPIQISPSPNELNRVFVGRIEVLLDLEEQQLLTQIQAQGKNFNVLTLGRMAHPVLLRVRELAQSRGMLNSSLAETFETLIARTF